MTDHLEEPPQKRQKFQQNESGKISEILVLIKLGLEFHLKISKVFILSIGF